jgi:hypothetical protein
MKVTGRPQSTNIVDKRSRVDKSNGRSDKKRGKTQTAAIRNEDEALGIVSPPSRSPINTKKIKGTRKGPDTILGYFVGDNLKHKNRK